MPSTYTRLTYHFVFSTKERRQLILPRMETELHAYIGGIFRDEGGILLEAGGIADHVHLLGRVPARMSVSEMLQRVKGHSSKWLNESGRSEVHFQWQEGYAGFTVSESQIDSVTGYIRNQHQHHARVSFQSELLALLKKHQIEIDERYHWD
jgi:REP element-mobilizing transposase RayT